MVDMPKDFLEPPKLKHKRILKAFGSPPIPLMHSPPRPPTMQDQLDWKVPPCISNWTNSKGYTTPLDKRLAADGRVVEEDTLMKSLLCSLRGSGDAVKNSERNQVKRGGEKG